MTRNWLSQLPEDKRPPERLVRAWWRAWRRQEPPLSTRATRPLTALGVQRTGLMHVPRMGEEMGYVLERTPHTVLVLTCGGEARCTSGERRWELRPGSVLVLPAEHQGVVAVQSKLWQMVYFVIDHEELRPAGPSHMVREALVRRLHHAYEGMLGELPEGSSRVRLFTDKGVPRLAPPLPPANDEPAEATYLYASILRTHLQRLLALEPDDWQQDQQRLTELWAKVRADLQRPWSVEELAREVNVSTATLHRLTRRRYDASPGEMLATLRMKEGEALLQETDLPLKAVALRLGYSSRTAFSMAFKRHAGVSPSEYRRSHAIQPHA